MQNTDSGGYPLGTRTSATDATFSLLSWDVATLALLKAIPSVDDSSHCILPAGRVESVRALNHQRYYWSATSILTADDQLIIKPDDVTHPAAGRWLAQPMTLVDLAMPFTYATADGATLFTVPAGCYLRVVRGYWEVTTLFAGGSSSAIGLASDQIGHTSAGDLLGGSSGDVEATLIVGDYIEGTVGTDQAAGIILAPGKLVTFERITSAFTSGVGIAHLVCEVLKNAGV